MHEVLHFGAIVLLVSAAFAVAVFSNKLSEWSRVPTAAFFLLAAAVAAEVWPALEDALSIQDVERIAVLALVVILFDGGMRVGWRRFRESAVPIVSLGLVGTFVTAGLMTLAAHYLLDFSWVTAWLIGAAIAPTEVGSVSARLTAASMSAIPTGSFAPDSPSRIVPVRPPTSLRPKTENITAGSVGASAAPSSAAVSQLKSSR